MKKIFHKEVIIGLVVLVSLAILFIGIEFLKGVNVFKPANFYTAKYENVLGLAVSAPVTINGFQVGLVREINYDYSQNGVIIVEISMDKNVKLPKGSKAVVGADMLGTATVQIELAQNSEYYEIGSELPGETRSGLMDEVSGKLLPAIANMIPKIDSIVSGVNILVNNPALNESISRLDKISKNLEQTTAALNSVMPSTMNNVKDVADNLNKISTDLSEVSATLKDMPIDSTMANINATTLNLRKATSMLNSKNSSLGLLLNDTTLYNNVNKTLGNVDSLLIDLKRNPKKYVNFKLF